MQSELGVTARGKWGRAYEFWEAWNEMLSMLPYRFSSNMSAAAAGEKMREKMAGSFAAMKNLNIGFNRQNTRN